MAGGAAGARPAAGGAGLAKAGAGARHERRHGTGSETRGPGWGEDPNLKWSTWDLVAPNRQPRPCGSKERQFPNELLLHSRTQTPRLVRLRTSVKKSESSSSRSTRVVSTRPPGAGDLIRSEEACVPTISAELCKCTPSSSHPSLPSCSHVPVGVKTQDCETGFWRRFPPKSFL